MLCQVHEKGQVLRENFCSQGNGFVGLDGAVRPDLQDELVIVRDLAHTGVLHNEVHLADGGEDRIYRDLSNGHIGLLVPIRSHITAAVFQDNLHIEPCAVIQGGQVQIRVYHFYIAVHDHIPSRYLAGAHCVYNDLFGARGMHLDAQIF
ncbi:hypothetical protein SDC9_187763 [bioreactor metagenome]|uniref:Uncharacterized protein n=1 Tax=bioreactor metagenome TaxID=1076179 RepID=A0A645HMP6_9ZZZZ